jgi:hypothetical protein
MFSPITEYDFRIYSEDRESHITFTVEEYLHERLASVSCTVEVMDNEFKGWNINVWFSIEDLLKFIAQLEDLNKSRQGKISLNAMSPEDFGISLESYNKRGSIIALYSISTCKLDNEFRFQNTLTGGFHIDSEFFSKLIDDFKHLTTIVKLKADTEFTC